MLHRSTEEELVRAATAGDEAAYAIPCDRLTPLVRAVWHDDTGNLADAQDLAQDVSLPARQKQGDESQAVCWWKPPGSSVYRVVYGDLSVRDVAPNDLPPIPWLVEQE